MLVQYIPLCCFRPLHNSSNNNTRSLLNHCVSMHLLFFFIFYCATYTNMRLRLSQPSVSYTYGCPGLQNKRAKITPGSFRTFFPGHRWRSYSSPRSCHTITMQGTTRRNLRCPRIAIKKASFRGFFVVVFHISYC